jgi:membrane protein
MNAVIEHMSAEGKDRGEKSPGEHEKQHVSGLGRDHSIPHPHTDET